MTGEEWSVTHALHDMRRPESFQSGCEGTFRIVENDGRRPATARCDGCGEELGVRQSTLAGPVPQEQPVIPF